MKPLQPLQYRAAVLLANGRSVSAAAGALRVHRSTLHLWLKHPDFKALIEDETRQAMAALRHQTNTDNPRQFLAMCSALQKNNTRERERKRAELSKSVEFPLKTASVPVFRTVL